MSFDLNSKSILKIVGNYEINNNSGNEITHNTKDDILTIFYDDYFYQATIGELDPKDDGGNTFSIMVEVPSFQSIEITALLRTKIDDDYVVIQTFSPISPPDDFLSKIDNITFEFVYDGPDNINVGCTQPVYPNYDCSARYDDSDNTHCDDRVDSACTDPTACSCDEPRCIGLCGVCDDGFSTNQYECTGVWTEYCGTDEQWRCTTRNFNFYNPSEYITAYNQECQYIPDKPEISIGVFDIDDDENGVTDLQFDDNDSFQLVKENNPIFLFAVK